MYNNVFIHKAWAANNIALANMHFNPLYYDTISPISLKITQTFHLVLDFAESQTVFCTF